jgi:hypothetical protein
VVAKYWEDVIKYSREPEFYLLPNHRKGLSIMTSNEIKKLIDQIISTKRQDGDLWPALLCRQFCENYELCDLNGRARFLQILGDQFAVNTNALNDAVLNYQTVQKNKVRSLNIALNRIRASITPVYDGLFTRIAQLPGGMKFLIDMRADANSLIKIQYSKECDLVQKDLKLKFQQWFGLNNLQLERITLQTSGAILEKIQENEAVHTIHSWSALKQRLGPGRFCYAFFHSSMPSMPLTFVHLAILDYIPDNIDTILLDPHPEENNATVAVFYSISSTQKGLAGVDLGNFLIKRVVKELQETVPSVTTFITLSPIPGFRLWLEMNMNQEEFNLKKQNPQISFKEIPSKLFIDEEIKVLYNISDKFKSNTMPTTILSYYLQKNLLFQPDIEQKIRPILMRLCSRYILLEKRRSFAIDQVANFHIRNGACVQKLNWLGDRSGI